MRHQGEKAVMGTPEGGRDGERLEKEVRKGKRGLEGRKVAK